MEDFVHQFVLRLGILSSKDKLFFTRNKGPDIAKQMGLNYGTFRNYFRKAELSYTDLKEKEFVNFFYDMECWDLELLIKEFNIGNSREKTITSLKRRIKHVFGVTMKELSKSFKECDKKKT